MVITKSEFHNFVAAMNSSFSSMRQSINKLQQGEERGKIEEKLDVLIKELKEQKTNIQNLSVSVNEVKRQSEENQKKIEALEAVRSQNLPENNKMEELWKTINKNLEENNMGISVTTGTKQGNSVPNS